MLAASAKPHRIKAAHLWRRKPASSVRFPGQYFDQEDGLYYNGHRDYDPALGRYIEFDPLGLGGGVNGYVYAENNPISNVDPLGLCPSHKCATPPAPPGASVDSNIRKVQLGMLISPGTTLGVMAFAMHSGGPWDYKNSYHNSKYDAFGNFNYGATGAALGIPLGALQWFAGAYQYSQGNSPSGTSPLHGGSNGDNPSSQSEIAAGVAYYQNCPHW